MKIGICGPGGSAKSEAARFLSTVSPLRYIGGTSHCFSQFVFERMLDEGYRYDSLESCFADRSNHRQFWADAIGGRVSADPVSEYRDCLADQDILEGIRRRDEQQACRAAGIVSLWLWIDRPGCVDPTCEVRPTDCNVTILNHGTLAEFHENLRAFAGALFRKVA
jgi:hypothetical protein